MRPRGSTATSTVSPRARPVEAKPPEGHGAVVRADASFVITPTWVLDADVSDRAVRLYGVLRNYADNATSEAYPSRSLLAARLRTSIKSVDRATAELEALGAITVTERHRPGGGQTSNLITLRSVRGGDTGVPPGATRVTHELDPSELEDLSPADAGARADLERNYGGDLPAWLRVNAPDLTEDEIAKADAIKAKQDFAPNHIASIVRSQRQENR